MQMQGSSMVIECVSQSSLIEPPALKCPSPALTTMNGLSSSPPTQYQQAAYLATQMHSRMQYPYQQPGHQPIQSINPSFVHTNASHYQQLQQPQSPLVRQSHSPQLQQAQGTLSPYALHQPGSNGGYYSAISPVSFYGQSPQPVAGPSSASPPALAAPQAAPQASPVPTPANPASKEQAEQKRAKFTTDLQSCIRPDSFTGGGAVARLATLLHEYGIAEVDVQTRLDVISKIRNNAGNHYYRAWADNIDAVDVIREWLKSAFQGRDDQQMVETIMPLLQIIDRLPLSLDKLKQSKLGKVIMKLVKEPPNPAIKDMAKNLERKWRTMLSNQDGTDRPDNESTEGTDARGKKRRADSAQPKSAPPGKKAAVPAAGSSTPKAVAVKKEAKPVVKDAKSDSSFFSKPKPTKKEMPSFKKNTPASAAATAAAAAAAAAGSASLPLKKEADPNVAQPSSVDAFQEILRAMGSGGAGPSNATPPPTNGAPSAARSAGSPMPASVLGKRRKKSVTWAPDGQLEQVKFIERAVYDDDGTGSLPTHNLRDLDRDEGAALHNHLFEEQVEWSEPQPLEMPPEIEIPPRGGESSERGAQEEREQSALVVSYASPAQIPDSPAEPPAQIAEEQVDDGVRIMLTGPEVDAIFWSDGAPASIDTLHPASSTSTSSVADLVGQLAATPSLEGLIGGSGAPPPAGAPPLAIPSPEQLQQLAQMLTQKGMLNGVAAGPPLNAPTGPQYGGEQGQQWGTGAQFAEHERGYHEPNGVGLGRGGEPNRRWEDGWGERGGPRGRARGGPPGRGRGGGRGDGFRNTKRKPCSFFQAGRCRYGDQCDFSHEPLNYN
ncbi:hypothetical protein BD413DRAFT_572014 [Trametes elegans]|nr:hypothetical protein BD413DRAFT_572014 [Trametes elegans]